MEDRVVTHIPEWKIGLSHTFQNGRSGCHKHSRMKDRFVYDLRERQMPFSETSICYEAKAIDANINDTYCWWKQSKEQTKYHDSKPTNAVLVEL
jgi:hypothetical protein